MGDKKRFGINFATIDLGISIGAGISYDKYNKERYLFINFIKWEIRIGWFVF